MLKEKDKNNSEVIGYFKEKVKRSSKKVTTYYFLTGECFRNKRDLI
jgi:hypothetical protein